MNNDTQDNPTVLYVPVHRNGSRAMPREFKTVALAWIIMQANADEWRIEQVSVKQEAAT